MLETCVRHVNLAGTLLLGHPTMATSHAKNSNCQNAWGEFVSFGRGVNCRQQKLLLERLPPLFELPEAVTLMGPKNL